LVDHERYRRASTVVDVHDLDLGLVQEIAREIPLLKSQRRQTANGDANDHHSDPGPRFLNEKEYAGGA
jgi:hypothetical protein